MRRVRPQRRSFIDLYRVTIGDYIIAVSSLLILISLFLPWFTSSLAGGQKWAFTYSETASIVVIVLCLAALSLTIYPALSSEVNFGDLPFATPVPLLMMGAILLLIFTYEVGRYGCIQCSGVSRGIGIWVALITTVVFLIGGVIKWGSRPNARL